jgi:head-tail adaptor
MQLQQKCDALQREVTEKVTVESKLHADISQLTSALTSAQDAHKRELEVLQVAASRDIATAMKQARHEGAVAGRRQAVAAADTALRDVEVLCECFAKHCVA